MTDRTRSTLVQVALVVVPALMSFAGSYAAVQASLAQKVDRVEFVREISRLDLALAKGDGVTSDVQHRIEEIQRDIRALVCAQRPRPATCPERYP